jgi:hypothetical protein
MTTKQSYIYIIHCKDLNTIKIGYSDNPFARLAQLQVGNSSELSILSIFKGGREEEEFLHKKFASNKVRGEWFTLDESLVEDLLAYQADTIAISIGDCKTSFSYMVNETGIHKRFDALAKFTQRSLTSFTDVALEIAKLAEEYAPAEKLDILVCRLKLLLTNT